MTSTSDPLLIVGGGIAGVSAAAAARKAGFTGKIVLLGDEPELPYRRPPVSKEVLRADKSADEIRIRSADWFADQEIELRSGEHVESIDPSAHYVTLAAGEQVRYQALLLATGGRPRTLDSITTPAAEPYVHTLRTLVDVEALRPVLAKQERLVVVGAGLIGAEIAASAREQGSDVTLIEAADLPLRHLVPTAIGRMYADLHTRAGVDLQLGVQVAAIDGVSGQARITSDDGRTWEAPAVVVAVGMVPNSELASAAGIETSQSGAIVVDEFGATSAPDVYAAGDVAVRPSKLGAGNYRIEHWQGAQNHGSAVGAAIAARLAGADPTAFDEVPWCWSEQYGLNLQVAGWPSSEHDMVLRASVADHDFTAFFFDGSALVGAVSLGRPAELRLARRWIAERADLDRTMLSAVEDLTDSGKVLR